MMKIYSNKRNQNKKIVVKRYSDCHYYVAQFMQWPNGVLNWTGNTKNRSRFRRVRKATLDQILEDYNAEYN